MCGIAGMLGQTDRALLEAMTTAIRHRGPDGEGFEVGDGFGFGHRRLAIIDIAGGAQPMWSENRRYVVNFNGEIYNFRALRAELEALGHHFHTNCDTEVLLVAYAEWREKMVERIWGMFVLALWDTHEKRALIARDRVGIKPLYYHEQNGNLLFASEPKALLVHPTVSRELDPVALDAYLDLHYVPPPLSMFRGMRQLAPGHYMMWQNGKTEITRYWDAPLAIDDKRSADEWAEEMEPILEDAIISRTMSDVPLGAFLSGGIDSSTIVAVLAEHSSAPVSTFCVGYGSEGEGFDERPMARLVAEHFGTDHHEIELTIDILAGLEPMVRGFDEPFGSSTSLLSSALSKFTRQFVTVSLAGDGGDEMFGGYPRYRGMLLSERVSRLPKVAISLGRRAIEGDEAAVARGQRRWGRQFLEGTQLPPAERYASWVGHVTPDLRDTLLTPAMRERVTAAGRIAPVSAYFEAAGDGDGVERAAYADLHGFLPDNVLRCSDRMSMQHSLELRVPFCDHRIVELAMKIPSRYRVSALASKRLLKKITKGKVPDTVLKRKKLGFNAPVGRWLQRDLDRVAGEWLSPEIINKRGWFHAAEVRRLTDEHGAGRRDHAPRLWSMIVLEQWARIYID